MKKKIVLRFTIIIVILGILLTIFELINFRNFTINSSVNKAEAISEVVKSGLTAHMINGNTNQRSTFLRSISEIENIESIWIVRGEKVNAQYGESLEIEKPRDQIDIDVLKTGETFYNLDETLSKANLRVTIPFKATITQQINCIQCHQVKLNDTLGAVSMVLDISEVKHAAINSVIIVIVITLVTILFIILYTNKSLNPYLDTIETLSKRIKDASIGVFKPINLQANLSAEAKELTTEYNSLVEKLNITFTEIDEKLKGFVGTRYDYSSSSLDNSNYIISNLSSIFQFKKEIELDNTKEEIYFRMAEIFQNKFNIKNFTLMEVDPINKHTSKVFSQGNLFFCCDDIIEDPSICRVTRNSRDVTSLEHHSACPCFKSKDHFYYCIDMNIGKNLMLVANFVTETKEELIELKKNVPFIKSYISEAAPSIEVKYLMDELKQSAFRDGLTGLYNRKFMDEHIKKLAPQAIREDINIGVLLLDMDHFKAVNDEYGHDIGDKVLKELARILLENVRESDIVIRYGGEEFVVLLVGVKSEEDALNVANKIRVAVSENEIDVYAGNKLKKTISIGLSMFPTDSKNIDSVIKNADIALYEAKNSGRNQVVRFEQNQVSSVDLF
jgi:two-component system cell cycle response regulator